MSAPAENLVLEPLRAIRASQHEMREDIREIKHRMTAVESQVNNLASAVASGYASLSMRMDRVERRLEIVPAD